MFFSLKFPETVRAEEEDQVGLQAPEDPHDSSTDTCLTFPYSSNSPRPFPPSPVHPVTDSPIRVSPLYFWPGYQPSLVSSRGPSAGEALNLATMPRTFDHFPGNLPSSPLHYDYFIVLRAASPVVTFHCPSPFTQQSFSSVYSITFPHGHDTKTLLIASHFGLGNTLSGVRIFS